MITLLVFHVVLGCTALILHLLICNLDIFTALSVMKKT